ncbi:MAG TPA: circularly permuted type 2 ATP-grasp protein, partial [Pirellulaceae bacterium]|nr:circularly permuted type 2 ATP-grasp protein [Pirellulaceae bacterium]
MTANPGTVETTTSPGGLFSGYAPPLGAFDELLGPDGAPRASWERFAQGLQELGPQALGQRAEQARRLLRENGVSYNVLGAPQGPDRPWELDPIPLVVPSADWRKLADGVAQRARLLNELLADLYGPQRLLAEGVLPPAMVFGHPGFLLPCHGLAPPQRIFLHLYAAHLARENDGRWVVLADRAQGPSGAGYALENRIVTSRVLPHHFQTLHVERLASFFIALRETLHSLAPRQLDNPRIVLLSPGPRSSTYFEDGYLARYLGYSLIEGGDLTVRGDAVYLKTLGGLLQVDVILRRLADDDCDPLELRADSITGVPGLLQAARNGQVVIANALGSGLLEAPALLAFLPEACRMLLGEELQLPSVPTWWSGRASDLSYILAHLDELIIRPAFLHRTTQPILGWQLSDSQRAELVDKLRRHPGQHVAQARVERSTAPVWTPHGVQPWRVGLRTFAAAFGNEYRVMPGGLSRVSAGRDFIGESLGAGQGSKDVWVLSEGPVETVTLLRPVRAAVELRRSVNDLPSRVADNLFWLGRHVERAEGMVRHLRSAVVRMTNELDPAGLPELNII